jgi:hypothetical protein
MSKKKSKKIGNNPRYIDRELEMKYGEGPGKQAANFVDLQVNESPVGVLVHSFDPI